MTESSINLILQRLDSIERKIDENKKDLTDKIEQNKNDMKEYVRSVSGRVDNHQGVCHSRFNAIEGRVNAVEIAVAKDHVKTESVWSLREKVMFWLVVALAGALMTSIGVK